MVWLAGVKVSHTLNRLLVLLLCFCYFYTELFIVNRGQRHDSFSIASLVLHFTMIHRVTTLLASQAMNGLNVGMDEFDDGFVIKA